MIYDLWEAATGWSIITTSALVVWQLTSLRLGEQVCRLCDYFSPKVDEYERLITDNPIFGGGWGVGTISREDAIKGSGPMLRGSGVNWDLGKLTTTSATTTLIGKCIGPVIALLGTWYGFEKCASR